MIAARHRDGTPVSKGDWVLVIGDGGRKFSGRIVRITGPMKFADHNWQELQTYMVNCGNGNERPTHAAHIKQVRRSFFRFTPSSTSRSPTGWQKRKD
jgi:hypothetical protein